MENLTSSFLLYSIIAWQYFLRETHSYFNSGLRCRCSTMHSQYLRTSWYQVEQLFLLPFKKKITLTWTSLLSAWHIEIQREKGGRGNPNIRDSFKKYTGYTIYKTKMLLFNTAAPVWYSQILRAIFFFPVLNSWTWGHQLWLLLAMNFDW